MLDQAPDPPPPLPDRVTTGPLEIENHFPLSGLVIVEATVGPPVRPDWLEKGWVNTAEIEQIIYHSDHLNPPDIGTVEVLDQSWISLGGLLHQQGQRVMLLLVPDRWDQYPLHGRSAS